MKVKFYHKRSGKKPVIEFIDDLPSDESAKILNCLGSVERMGFESPVVEFRQIKGSLWEIKIKTHRAGYRIFYVCIKKDMIVLLHAYKKQGQKAPKKEIEKAEERMQEVMRNESHYIN